MDKRTNIVTEQTLSSHNKKKKRENGQKLNENQKTFKDYVYVF